MASERFNRHITVPQLQIIVKLPGDIIHTNVPDALTIGTLRFLKRITSIAIDKTTIQLTLNSSVRYVMPKSIFYRKTANGHLVAREGIEPTPSACKTEALPLDERAVLSFLILLVGSNLFTYLAIKPLRCQDRQTHAFAFRETPQDLQHDLGQCQRDGLRFMKARTRSGASIHSPSRNGAQVGQGPL